MAGAAPTATRAMALNFGMLAGNAVAKDARMSKGYIGIKAKTTDWGSNKKLVRDQTNNLLGMKQTTY